MPFDPPIVLSGELSMNDVRKGLRLAQASFLNNLTRAVLILVTVMCLGVWGTIAFSGREVERSATDRILVVIAGVVPLLTFGHYVWMREWIRQSWRRRDGLFSDVSTTISDQGVVMQTPYARSDLQWPHFIGVRRSEDAVVLYTQGGGWVFFARSRFQCDEDWSTFVDFVTTTIPFA